MIEAIVKETNKVVYVTMLTTNPNNGKGIYSEIRSGKLYNEDELKIKCCNGVRNRFRVSIRKEDDAREGFQEKVTVWIDNTGHGLPAMSIEELTILRDELSEYINS